MTRILSGNQDHVAMSDVPALSTHRDCICQAVAAIFSSVCGVELEPHEATADAGPTGDIVVGVISLVGDVDWSVWIALPRGTAVQAVESFAGFEVPFESEDMTDALGELVNMVAGDVKLRLDRRRVRAEIPLPTVIRGGDIRILTRREVHTEVAAFESPWGAVWAGVVASTDMVPARQAGTCDQGHDREDMDVNTTGTSQSTSLLEHKGCVPEAVAEIFRSVCGLEVQPAEAGALSDVAGAESVVAIISLVGDVDWSVYLGLPRETAEVVVAQFAGFEIPFDSDDMGDAVGELANMMAGDVKARLDRKAVKTEISLPTVIRGSEVQVLTRSDLPSEVTRLTSPCGPLWAGVVASTDVVPT